MIALLPQSLDVNNKQWAIRSDYRVALTVFTAFADPELSEREKIITMLECLYVNAEELTAQDMPEAIKKAVWFLDGGAEAATGNKPNMKLYDWEQDEKIIFSAINKIAGYETRLKEYIHWWTFLGYFYEIGESVFSTVVAIRKKKAKGKKLEKYEQEYYAENKDIINLKSRLTEEETAQKEELEKLLDGKLP